MRRVFIAFFGMFAIFALFTRLEATPGQVLLLRHAEKPPSGNCLSKEGFERAAAFVPFFTLPPANSAFQTPVAIFAQIASKNHKSTRPVQTVCPLATALGIPLIAEYTFADYVKMVKDINGNTDYNGKTILICWAHQNIQNIATAFGVKNAPVFPSAYDRIWVIDFTGDNATSLQDIPQKLMYGDSSK